MAALVQFCRRGCQCFPAYQEQEFKQSLQGQFVIPCYVACFFIIVRASWMIWQFGLFSDDHLLQYVIALNFCVLAVTVSLMAMLCLRKWAHVVDLEFCCIATALFVMTFNSASSLWVAAAIFGRDPHEAFGPSVADEIDISQLWSLLRVLVATTICCVIVPIRSHLSWLIPLGGFLVYVPLAIATSARLHPLAILYACVLGGGSWLGGYRHEAHLRKEWLAEREVKKQEELSEKQRQGFAHLLNRLCDCLLNLGPDLEIMEASPNLAAMLFFTDRNALQGSSFCDLLASEDDRRIFVAALDKNNTEAESSGMLPLHLRDAHGREVQVHFYYTSFLDREGSPHHIAGIVEAGRPHGDSIEGDDVAPSAIGQSAGTNADAAGVRASAESEGVISLESVASSDLGQVSITFHDAPPLNIISCTPECTSLCGPIGDDTNFLDWIGNKHEFLKYLQCAANHFVAIPNFQGLVLKPPYAVRAGIEYLIQDCVLDAMVDSGQLDNASGGRFAVRMHFLGVRRKKYHRKKDTTSPSPRMRSTEASQAEAGTPDFAASSGIHRNDHISAESVPKQQWHHDTRKELAATDGVGIDRGCEAMYNTGAYLEFMEKHTDHVIADEAQGSNDNANTQTLQASMDVQGI